MIHLRSTSRIGPRDGDPPAIPSAIERRLSAMQRDASRLAMAALHRAGLERIDAIIASTALGCLDDTERFLADMHDADGALLSPLPFMRSTHNTVAGQLALMLQCDGPNITHAHGLNGFHTALVESLLLLREKPEWNILVIAIDERTDLLDRIGAVLDPAVKIGSGGEAFIVAGIERADDIARVDWAEDASAGVLVPMTPGTSRGLHGSLLAEHLGDALFARVRTTQRIGSTSNGAMDILVTPC